MRRQKKRQIVELIQEFEQVVPLAMVETVALGMAVEVVQAIEDCFNKNIDNNKGVYQECFSGVKNALVIGRSLKEDSERKELVNLVGELLEQVKVLLEAEPVAKVAVFLPYKVSMWDSLESVWRAAAQDEECEAVVMPIPYCDRNPDGSPREWHYEGAEFPEDVPITHYDSLDLEALHPDTIFIHNPYDEYNLVTSVDSKFYASVLKDYTDKLVYIPYFVSNDKTATTESVKWHIKTPGIQYAHLVILQSEQLREVYLDSLVEEYGEADRNYWEKKIVGWGSPKFDKAHEPESDNIANLPEDWQKKLKRSDGSRKKVIMYGTGLSAFLKHGEVLLEKIRRVLAYFKQHTEDILLLWRPHPLIPATLNSMRPQLSEAYEAVCEQYKIENWGIFDDSGDLHRAIDLSDAYYGDGSSVTNLFQDIGKPVMMENVEI